MIMRVCIIASRLFIGGFTSSMLNMISAMEKNNIDVDILFLTPENHELKVEDYLVIKILPFRLEKLKRSDIYRKLFIKRIDYINKKIDLNLKKTESIKKMQYSILRTVFAFMPKLDLSEYDAVISWEELTCNYFLAYNVKAKKKIGYVHPDYKKANFSKEVDYPSFKKLDKIVSVSEETNEIMKQVFPKLKNKMIYIPNVNNVKEIRKKAEIETETFEKSEFDIITVCRLDNNSKALDRLLRIAEKLEQNKINFEWYIVGEGPSRKELEKYINEHKIENVTLVGKKDNPYPYIKKADLFVLQSFYEGKPMVIDESIIIGTPILVTDYNSAKEQVSKEYGYIVENNENAIYEKIVEVIENRKDLELKKEYLKTMSMEKYENIDKMIKCIKEN